MKKRISKFNKQATEQFKNLKNYLLKIIEIIKKPEMGIRRSRRPLPCTRIMEPVSGREDGC